jgi:hypothetical protein
MMASAVTVARAWRTRDKSFRLFSGNFSLDLFAGKLVAANPLSRPVALKSVDKDLFDSFKIAPTTFEIRVDALLFGGT